MPAVSAKSRLEAREKPQEAPIMYQQWRNMLFLHWKHDAEKIQKTLPPGLYVDTYKDDGYVTLNAFFINGVQMGTFPSVPGFSDFIEVNLRTYVYDDNGIPGVWFYSLDLDSMLAATTARQIFGLPYYYTEFKGSSSSNEFMIEGERNDSPTLNMKFAYKVEGKTPYFAKENTLDFFLIERYILFTFIANQLNIGHVSHNSYPLASASLLENKNTFGQAYNLKLSNKPDHINFSTGVDVEIFNVKKDLIYKKAKNAS